VPQRTGECNWTGLDVVYDFDCVVFSRPELSVLPCVSSEVWLVFCSVRPMH